MGTLDDFLRAHVSPGLWAGEQLLGFAHLRQPSRFNRLGVPTHYVEWLAAATSARLLLFRTEADGMFLDEPRPAAQETIVWSYDELARVELGNVEGLTSATSIRLFPHPLCGPDAGKDHRYDMYPAAKRLDDHQRFRTQYPPWLQQQVAAGAFPMAADKHAALAARIASERAASDARMVAERAAQAEQHARLEQGLRRALPWVVTLGFFAASIAAGVFSYLERSGDDDLELFGEHFNPVLLGLSTLLLVGAIVALALMAKKRRTAGAGSL